MNKKTFVFVFGTRPEFIKLWPLILEAKKYKNINTIVCSTGQHKEMLESLYLFFDCKPDYNFNLMKPNQSLSHLHAETMRAMDTVLLNHRPDWVVVQGDTTSAHAAAMSAFYQKIAVAHIEAGLRTYDIQSPFPEEMNRRAIGLIAKAHFCPTEDAAHNLRNEKTDQASTISVTGNTGIDMLNIVSNKIQSSSVYQQIFKEQFSYLNNEKFVLVTMHRRENFGLAQKEILKALLKVVQSRQINILFPVHPNPNVLGLVENVYKDEMGRSVFWASRQDDYLTNEKSGKIFLTEPLDYPALIYIMQKCDFLLTDSGGLQEEAPTFGKKILVLRKSTERPEGIQAGFSKLVGTDYNRIVDESLGLLDSPLYWTKAIPQNPFGDGRASSRIMDALVSVGL